MPNRVGANPNGIGEMPNGVGSLTNGGTMSTKIPNHARRTQASESRNYGEG
jgi:hypothetical protein